MKIIVRLVIIAVTLIGLGVVVEAQQPKKIFRIALLTWAAAPPPSSSSPFDQGLLQLGYVEGQNIAIERRYANGQMDRLPQLAAELAHLPLDVILTQSFPAALAAKQATSTIPIVVIGAGDPVATGLVASFARPGGNITGVSAPGNGAERQTSRAVEGSLSQVGPRGGPLECGGFWHDP
jgi:putative tryptophan/tyrosine transport system substrate-binding protein